MTSKRHLTENSTPVLPQPSATETSKKRKKLSSDVSQDVPSTSNPSISNNEKHSNKNERRLQKAQRKEEKAQLLERVPKVDSNGIAYTKIQIRRMMRRVKNGLPPVPTEEEERETKRQRKREKQIEEAELAGILYDRKSLDNRGMDDGENEDNEDDDDEDGNDDVKEQDEDEGELDFEEDDDVYEDKQKSHNDSIRQDEKVSEHSKSQKARNKPVPSGYICQACQNKHSPIHWIYDCPDKIHRPGCNQLAKKDRGIHIPSARKVFVSGLPFDWKHKDVVDLFRSECGAKVEHCKLLMFEDRKRCKGQAFVTFDSEESAKKGLKLHGKVLGSLNKMNTKDGKSDKELTLGVTKVQNRRRLT